MTTRRNFIKNTSVAAAALTIMQPTSMFNMVKNKHIGIQLYTIRKELEKNFNGSLIKIAKIGFTTIEAAGYGDRKFYGYEPKAFKKYTKDIGLKTLSSHANVQLDNLDYTIEDHLNAGMKYLVKPGINHERRKSIDGYKKVAEEFNIIGEKCKKAGLRFAYHNHSSEFTEMEGQIPYDVLLDNTDPDYFTMQLDTYWIKRSGNEPLEYFKKYPGRFELLHIKDMEKGGNKDSTEVGNGVIDFKQIFAESKLSGMKHFFLEQESFKIPVFESLEKSFDYLKNI